MEGAEVLTHAWKAWGIQALVLLSFTLQVTLLILAQFRRWVDSGVLRFFVWSAYMTADATAIFVLGHMSVTSRSPEHELVAFWAPFLLMHLGGQDSITAYAMEDNRLWLRHLQTLAVQAAAAGYVIYESFIVGSPSLLRWATIIMFVVGTVKYGERVWALKCAGSSPAGKNYRVLDMKIPTYRADRYLTKVQSTGPTDTEAYLLMAHKILDAPMDLLKGPQQRKYETPYKFPIDLRAEGRLYKVVELQLSLMYDVFYTKAEVMHNLYGLCIRMFSAVATATALLLFHLLIVLGGQHCRRFSYNRVDMAVTYVLLVGAVVLETASLCREMFSSWTCALLIRWNSDINGMKHILIHFVVRSLKCLRRLVRAADWRRRCSWSRSMGQHSLLQVCTRSVTSRRSKIARWIEAEDWWNTLTYSWSIPVSASIEELLMDKVLAFEGDDSFDSWGEAELKRWGLHEQENLENRIIIWHIATSVYLSWCYKKQQAKTSMAEAVEALSNYMMFLLASRPHMLHPTASRKAYVETCYRLTTAMMEKQCSTDADLVRCASETTPIIPYGKIKSRLDASCALGEKLIREEESGGENNMLELLAQVWVEALCYAGKRCSTYSHAKQLSTGSELTTVAALLIEHMKIFVHMDKIEKIFPPEARP